MDYFLGGYYLTRLKPLTFGSNLNSVVYTASGCINDNLVDGWSYPSDKPFDRSASLAKRKFGLDDGEIEKIRNWVGLQSVEGDVGWPGVFSNGAAALEYREKFFPRVKSIEVLALYFKEREASELVEEFTPQSPTEGTAGICQNLLKRVSESVIQNEEFVGYDLLGFEHGTDFHSFHCHDIGEELSERFDLRLNNFGLFEPHDDWKPVLDFLNDEDNGCEPVPWFVAKVKRLRIE